MLWRRVHVVIVRNWFIQAIVYVLAATLRCTSSHMISFPTVGEDGRVYACAKNKALAFERDGTLAWSAQLNYTCKLEFAPVIDGKKRIVRSDGWLYSFASWQPFLRWRYDLHLNGEINFVGVTAGSNGRIYVAVAEQRMVYALVAELGTLLWQKEVGPLGTKCCFPVVDLSGWVSIGSLDGFLYTISPDGLQLKTYLAASAQTQVVIQTTPLMDCSGNAIYVAQLRVLSKMINQIGGAVIVSFTKAWAVNLWMLVPSTGIILWSAWYPGSFPAELLGKDLKSYAINSRWLISLAAAANLSNQSTCQTAEKKFQQTCSQWTFTIDNVRYSDNRKEVIVFSLFVTLTVPILMLTSILLYRWWSDRQEANRRKLCEMLRRNKFLEPQALQTRKKGYEVALANLQIKLQNEPESEEVLNQLQSNLEGLHLVESLLSEHFSYSSIPRKAHGILPRIFGSYNSRHSNNLCNELQDVVDIPSEEDSIKRLTVSANQFVNPLYRNTQSLGLDYLENAPSDILDTREETGFLEHSTEQERLV